MEKQLATGLQFYPILSQSMSNALVRLCDLYAQPKVWTRLQRNAMAHPVSWAVQHLHMPIFIWMCFKTNMTAYKLPGRPIL